MRDVVAFTAPVVYHGGVDPTVGVYGIEGSKPGAAAAAVWLSHQVIPPDQSGYGRLLGRCIFNSKRFYAALLALPDRDDPFTVTPFQRLPAEKSGATAVEIEEQRQTIARRIASIRHNRDLVESFLNHPELFKLFKAMGSDQTIVTYAFNFKVGGELNTDLALMNEMNDTMFQAMSIQRFNGGKVPSNPMFVTASEFDPAVYGQDFVDDFVRRAGAQPVPGVAARFLISTQQNPWLTESAGGDVLPRVMDALHKVATDAAGAVMSRHGLA